jgi:hypothetical protein
MGVSPQQWGKVQRRAIYLVLISAGRTRRPRGGGSGGIMPPIARRGNRRILGGMDEKLMQEKLAKAIDEANAFIQANHLFLDEAIEYLANHLATHHDPAVRSFPEWYDRHVRRDLS